MRFTTSEFNVSQIARARELVFLKILLLITACDQMNGPATITVVICNTTWWIFVQTNRRQWFIPDFSFDEKSHRSALSKR